MCLCFCVFCYVVMLFLFCCQINSFSCLLACILVSKLEKKAGIYEKKKKKEKKGQGVLYKNLSTIEERKNKKYT